MNVPKKKPVLSKFCRLPWRQCGFTMIELMVVIVVIGITALLAMPSVQTIQRNSQLTSISNDFIASLNTARTQAMKTGNNAMVVPNDGINWSSGWTVFVDVANSRKLEGNEGQIIVKADAPYTYITMEGTGTASGTSPYMMFNAQGFTTTKASSFGTVNLSIARNDVNAALTKHETRVVILTSTGRARVCRPATKKGCSITATS